jgi:predicted MPP superfamily phosphohydrolase
VVLRAGHDAGKGHHIDDALRLATSFRAARLPAPLEPFDITLPSLPTALDGLRVLHLSDLHVRRKPGPARRWRALLDALRRAHPDVVAYTGDYMDDPGHEGWAVEALVQIVDAIGPGPSHVGVFGNHDTPALKPLVRAALPRVAWLDGQSVELRVRPGAGIGRASATPARLRVLGLSFPEDPLAAVLDAGLAGAAASGSAPTSASSDRAGFVLTLAHYPSTMFHAASLGLPLVLAGHTHAGQIRLSRTFAPHTSCDLPPQLASGCVRLDAGPVGGPGGAGGSGAAASASASASLGTGLATGVNAAPRSTLCCISRGIGDGGLEGLRINCPCQVPLYTLRRGPLPERSRPAGDGLEHESAGEPRVVIRW